MRRDFIKIILIGIIVVLIGVVGYFSSQVPPTPQDENANWRIFRNEKGVEERFSEEGFEEGFDEGFKERFEIKLPPTWVVGAGGGVYNFRDSADDTKKGKEPIIQIGKAPVITANFDDEFMKLFMSSASAQNLKHTLFNTYNTYEFEVSRQVFDATENIIKERKTFEVWMEHDGRVFYIVFNNRHRENLSLVEKEILASFKILE